MDNKNMLCEFEEIPEESIQVQTVWKTSDISLSKLKDGAAKARSANNCMSSTQLSQEIYPSQSR